MQIGAYAFVRLLISLRRIWKSLDRIADAQETMMRIESRRFHLDYPERLEKIPRKTEMGVVDVADLNKKWQENQRGY